MKKVLPILLALAMVFSIPLTAFAAEPDSAVVEKTTDLGFAKESSSLVINNGSMFNMYSPNVIDSAGSTILSCDGTYFTRNSAYKKGSDGTTAPNYATLQYRTATGGNYELTYHVVPTETKSLIWNYVHWQDYLDGGNTGSLGRSFQTMRSVGYLLTVNFNYDAENNVYTGITLGARANDNAGGGAALTATSGTATAALFEGLAADASREVVVSVKWEDGVMTASAALASDSSKTTGDVVFNTTTYAKAEAIETAITNPAGFAITWISGSPKVGVFTTKDLEKSGATATPIVLRNTTFKNNDQFYTYDPEDFIGATGDTIFKYSSTADATASDYKQYLIFNPDWKNPNTGAAAAATAVLQYRKAVTNDYKLSYNIVANSARADRVYTMFHWQSYTNEGRAYQTSQRAAGFSLQTQIDGNDISFTVYKYAIANGAGSTVNPTSGNKTTTLLTESDGEFVLNLAWVGNVLTVSASLASDPTKTTGDVVFDLSGETELINAITPEGFGIMLTPAEKSQTESSAIGKIKLTEYVNEAVPAEAKNYVYALNDINFGALTEGDKFVLNNNGWFTRSASTATENAIVTYSKNVSYNYELQFNLKFDASNKGRFGVWNIWSGSYASTKFGYMLVICTETDGTLGYRLCRYGSSYSLVNTLATDATKDNVAGSTILQGQPANTEMLVKITVQDQTLSVVTSLVSDPSKTTGTVIYDLSGENEKVIHKNVDRTLGYSFIDMALSANGGATSSASFGNVVYTALPGEAPVNPEDVDTNDYAAILNETYAWNGDIAASEENFTIYSTGEAEKFTVTDGWFTRPAADTVKTVAAGETLGNALDAYGSLQFNKVMDSGDYRLQFSVKLDEQNRGRFNVMTRWEDKDDLSYMTMKNQIGFRIYFFTDTNKLYVRCYQTTGGYLNPVDATKDNYGKLDLSGLPANTELVVTIAMKGDYVVTEVHVASDATKSGGVMAFDLSQNPSLLGQVDRTQGFLIVDSANELKASDTQFGVASASYSNIKLWAAAAPTAKQSGGDDDFDPDDLNTGSSTTAATEAPTAPATEAPTTEPASTEDTDVSKKGCSSSVSVAAAAVLLTAMGGCAVVLGKKKKED